MTDEPPRPFKLHDLVRWTDDIGTFEGVVMDTYREMGLYEWEVAVRVDRIIALTEKGKGYLGSDRIVDGILHLSHASARWTVVSAVDRLGDLA